jgi:hypothetical protein
VVGCRIGDYGQDLRSQYLIFNRHPEPKELERLAALYIPVLEEINISSLSWENSYLGIIQLFVLVMINKKYREVDFE